MKTGLPALALLALLATACSKVTQENYDKLKIGMSFDETQRLLGKPDECSEVVGIRTCRWGDDKRSINVNFVGGSAVVFSSANIH